MGIRFNFFLAIVKSKYVRLMHLLLIIMSLSLLISCKHVMAGGDCNILENVPPGAKLTATLDKETTDPPLTIKLSDEANVVKVQFVKKLGNLFAPVGNEVTYGDILCVEVLFSSKPKDDERDVSLILNGNSIDTITVSITDNPKIFRSVPFVLTVPEIIL